MICPHCGYEHGFHWKDDEPKTVTGAHGDFFELSNDVKMVRANNDYWRTEDSRSLYGCPSCNKLFMDH